MVATFTGESVSAQTVSKLTRELDEAVGKFHSAALKDEWTASACAWLAGRTTRCMPMRKLFIRPTRDLAHGFHSYEFRKRWQLTAIVEFPQTNSYNQP